MRLSLFQSQKQYALKAVFFNGIGERTRSPVFISIVPNEIEIDKFGTVLPPFEAQTRNAGTIGGQVSADFVFLLLPPMFFQQALNLFRQRMSRLNATMFFGLCAK